MNPNQQYNIPEENNIDPFRASQGIVPSQSQRYEAQMKRQRQIRKNIERVKTPIQKLQGLPILKLDYDVLDSLKTQFNDVCLKISYVLIPRSDSNTFRLRNWDLWGPFLFILVYAFFIDNSDQLVTILISIVIGAYAVSFNVVALGGRVSFFQTIAILNYCIFPIYLSIFVEKLLQFFQVRHRILSFGLIAAAVIWCILSVRIFIGVNVPQNKKLVAVFPAVLFYIYIGILLAFE